MELPTPCMALRALVCPNLFQIPVHRVSLMSLIQEGNGGLGEAPGSFCQEEMKLELQGRRT